MNVLIIDDSRTVRCFHRDALAPLGHAIDEAANGLEALERCLSTPPDLMLVDVNMPKMDGYSFLEEVRTSPSLQHIPAIMISTEAQQVDLDRAYRAGASLYLVKPADPEQLRAFATTLLHRES